MKTQRAGDFFVLGYFGFVTNQLDGQTVKTRSVHQLFEEKLERKVPFYDTEQLKKGKWGLICALFKIIKSKYLIYLPAQNSLKQFFPILFVLSKIFRFKIYYFVVGGWLMEFISEHPSFGGKLKNVSGIFVETNKLMSDLKVKGFKNVAWFPNFRFSYTNDNQIKTKSDELRIVFMSRITKLKGVDEVLNANKSLCKLLPETYSKIRIDFFGPVDSEYKVEFFEQISLYENTSYEGILKPEEIVSFLASNYDVMIFPTRYPGEGCPGAIIDAYMAGLPVIATDWKYNNEFVKDGITGVLISNEKVDDQIVKQIVRLYKNPSLIIEMKQQAHKEALRYSAYNAWEIIKDKIEV